MVDISPEVGITEEEIVRVSHRLHFGQTENDIVEFYRIKGKDPAYARMVYAAAKTYIKINDKDFVSHR